MQNGTNAARMPMSPLRMLILVLIVVFTAEAGVMLLLPWILPETVDERARAVADSFLLTAISAPILWYVIVGPMRRWEREAIRAESLATVAQLATGVAHEVRNPLTSIKLLVQNQLQTARVPTLCEDLKVIEEEIRRMESTLNSFLDFARPTPPQRKPLELSGVVDRTLALLDGRIGKQNVRVQFETPVEPLQVHADAEQLRQVLLNLSLNAIEMMPRGGTLDIHIQRCHDHHVCLEVADTGPGIAKENMSKMFQPFFTTRETGVGLGLVISRRIAQDHGGDLLFKNRPEGGACFTLRLPLLD
ncbi:MAG: hypothetical protein KDA42_07680 [Planctomycetales bacterium]|nr:hypothetical protein [Planctomycetales bacterium]